MLFNEPKLLKFYELDGVLGYVAVSVLFNEPKLLKYFVYVQHRIGSRSFSALQRAEIAEMKGGGQWLDLLRVMFQCSSTSRNC